MRDNNKSALKIRYSRDRNISLWKWSKARRRVWGLWEWRVWEQKAIWSHSIPVGARVLIPFNFGKGTGRAQPSGHHWITQELQLSFVTRGVCLWYHSSTALRKWSQGKKCVMLSFFSYPHKCLGAGAWIIEDDKKHLYLTLECIAILTYIDLWGASILEIPFKNHRRPFCGGQSLLQLLSCSPNLRPHTSPAHLSVFGLLLWFDPNGGVWEDPGSYTLNTHLK